MICGSYCLTLVVVLCMLQLSCQDLQYDEWHSQCFPQIHCLELLQAGEVPNGVKDDLFGCQEIGERWHQEFVAGCFDDEKWFDKPVCLRKVKKFTTAANKCIVRDKDHKLVELKNTCDFSGRLLYIGTQENVDLIDLPVALSHRDGSIIKTDKSKLMIKLESTAKPTQPPTVVTLVDVMFNLHILSNIPETYGELAVRILKEF